MVAPANTGMPFNCLFKGLTTISAVSRNSSDGVRRGKARQKNQLQDVTLAEARGLLVAHQASFESFVLDPIWVEAGAVVGDLDVHLAPFVKRSQMEQSLGRFAALE